MSTENKSDLGLFFTAIAGLVLAVFILPVFLALYVFIVLCYLAYKSPFYYFLKSNRAQVGDIFTCDKHWKWQEGGTCAIEAQRIVLKMSGVDRSVSDLASRQAAFGEFHPGKGSTSVKLLLEGYGVKVKSFKNEQFKWHEITAKLVRGDLRYRFWKKLKSGSLILATVNSYILNTPDGFDLKSRPVHDHVIIVMGLVSIRGSLYVFYTDTGCFDGSVKSIAFGNFLRASAGSNYVEVPKVVPKNNFNIVESKYTVACPRCRSLLKVPFGKKGHATCKKCSVKFEINSTPQGSLLNL